MKTTPEILLDKERFCIEMGMFHAENVRVLLGTPEGERNDEWLADYNEEVRQSVTYIKQSNRFSAKEWLKS